MSGLSWEAEAIKDLKASQEFFGWCVDDKEYIKRKKEIVKQGYKKLKAASPIKQRAAGKVFVGKKFDWVSIKEVKAKSFAEAYKHLTTVIEPGIWKRDPSCPSSMINKKEARRRMMQTEDGQKAYARVVEVIQGKKYDLQQGTVHEAVTGADIDDESNDDSDAEEEEQEESDSEGTEPVVPEPRASKKAAPAKKAAAKKAAAKKAAPKAANASPSRVSKRMRA